MNPKYNNSITLKNKAIFCSVCLELASACQLKGECRQASSFLRQLQASSFFRQDGTAEDYIVESIDLD